jgi:excisionase family DNA binding protein
MSEEFAEYISVAEASEKYKTARTYFYDLIKSGKIAGYELPGRRGQFMLRKDVEAFWKPKKIEPGSQERDETA